MKAAEAGVASLIDTAMINGVDPFDYLKTPLERIIDFAGADSDARHLTG